MKIYIPERLVGGPSHIPLLYPLWGFVDRPKRIYENRAANSYTEQLFEQATDINMCDFIIVPYDYFEIAEYPEYIRMIVKLSETHHKPILLFDFSDYVNRKIQIKNSIVFRVSAYRTQLPGNTIVMPYYTEDLGKIYGYAPKELSTKPTVGFCGWAGFSSMEQAIKAYLKNAFIVSQSLIGDTNARNRQQGVILRKKIIFHLKADHRLQTNLIIRQSFSSHLNTIAVQVDQARDEFVKNIQYSDFSLAIRGDANASVRFFEILSLGRIPFLLDSDVALPLEDIVNYNDCVVRLKLSEIGKPGDVLIDRLKHIGPSEFMLMQENARLVYEKYLRPDSYFRYVFQSNYLNKYL